MRDDYPYLIQGHMYQYDLHWIVENIQNIWKDIDASVELHTIKYADPIQWDITTQYQANTVVIDPKTGTAYISTKPVPSGILLTDTNYWTVVFNFQKVYTDIMKNISENYEEGGTATVNLKAFDLVWVDDILYYALHNINIGDAYVPDANIKQTTVEKMLAISFKNNMLNFIGEDRTTTLDNDILNVSGDWTVNAGDITQDSNNLTVTVKNDALFDFNSASAKVREKTFPIIFPDKTIDLHNTIRVNVKDYGAIGDGIHDDTESIVRAITENSEKKYNDFFVGTTIFFPSGVYKVSNSIEIPAFTYLIGESKSATILYLANNTNKPLLKTKNFDVLNADKHKRWYLTNKVPNMCGVKHMLLFGNYWNNAYDALVQLYGCNISFNDVFFYGFAGWGVYQEWGDGVGEEWTLNYDKMSENTFTDCFFFEGQKGIYQSRYANDVSYSNIFMGRIANIGAEIYGTSYFNSAHFYDCNRSGKSDYGLRFSAQGKFNLIIESMHAKTAVLFNGYFQEINAECYLNESTDVQLSNNYSNTNLKINTDEKPKIDCVYITKNASNNIQNIVIGGKNGRIFCEGISNSIININSDIDVLLGQGGAFTNVTGNVIGKNVVPGSGSDNVWYPGKH